MLNGIWGCRVLLPLVILKGRKKWIDEDIDSFQFGSLNNILSTKKKKPCAASRRKKKKNSCKW